MGKNATQKQVSSRPFFVDKLTNYQEMIQISKYPAHARLSSTANLVPSLSGRTGYVVLYSFRIYLTRLLVLQECYGGALPQQETRPSIRRTNLYFEVISKP